MLVVSERRACKAIGQHRSTQRKLPTPPADEKPLTAAIIRLTQQYGRYGYRRITALVRNEGWLGNAKRVERIWRCEGLKVPKRQPKRGITEQFQLLASKKRIVKLGTRRRKLARC